MKVLFLTLFSILFALSQKGRAQENLAFKFSYDVHRTYQGLSIERIDVQKSKTLSDFNKHFKESWVKEYLSVSITTIHNGATKIAIGASSTLTDEQRTNINTSDNGSDTKVIVRYLPNNNLKHNDIKTFDFSFIIEPDREASFPGGQQALKHYLTKHIYDQVNFDIFRQYHLSAAKFTVDTDGHVIDVIIAESSGDTETDNLLLKAACNMPKWHPATYANGQKVKQDFMLTAGDINSCVVNLINIRHDLEIQN